MVKSVVYWIGLVSIWILFQWVDIFKKYPVMVSAVTILIFSYFSTFLFKLFYWLMSVLYYSVPFIATVVIPAPVEVEPTYFEIVLDYIKTRDVLQLLAIVQLLLLTIYVLFKFSRYFVYYFVFVIKRVLALLQRVTFSAGFQVERMMPNSILENAVIYPKFQATISISDGGPFRYSGQGFLAGNYFWTAHHVIEPAKIVRLETAEQSLEIPVERFEAVEGDIARCVLTEVEASRLQIRKAKFVKVPLDQGQFVKVQTKTQSSMGIATKHEAIGFMLYNGSTVKGFSGAPYYVGNSIFGMHIGGGVLNMGYEGAYMHMLNEHEESEDPLIKALIEQDEEPQVSYSPYNPNDVRVRTNQGYVMMDYEDYLDMKEKRKKKGKNNKVYHLDEEESALIDYIREAFDEEDLEEVSELPLAPRGATTFRDSENLIQPQPFVSVGAVGMQPEPSTVAGPSTQMQGTTELLSQVTLETSDMDGQELTPAQPSAVLPSTSKSTNNKKKLPQKVTHSKKLDRLNDRISGLTTQNNSRNVQMKKALGRVEHMLQHLMQQQKVTQPGKQTSEQPKT